MDRHSQTQQQQQQQHPMHQLQRVLISPVVDEGRWAVVPDHPDSKPYAALPMASGAAAWAVTSATGSTSGSFAAWAKSEQELVGALSVVDEREL